MVAQPLEWLEKDEDKWIEPVDEHLPGWHFRPKLTRQFPGEPQPRGRSLPPIDPIPLENHESPEDFTHEVRSSSLMTDTGNNFAVTLARIGQLPELDEEEGEEDMPTREAIEAAINLVVTAYFSLGTSFPRATAAIAPHNGVYVYWKHGKRRVQLIVPARPAGAISIYHQELSEYNIERSVGAGELERWLDWLLQG